MTVVRVETVNTNYVLEGKYNNRERKNFNIKEPLGKEPEERKNILKTMATD